MAMPAARLNTLFSPVSSALLAGLVLAVGCTPPAEAPAAPEAAAVTELPADRWLTAETALPVDGNGEAVRDADRRPYGYALLGAEIPDFSLATPDGRPVTREDLRGRWTVLDFWGIWCSDCRTDAPLTRELARLSEADPVIDFLAVHTPPSRARADEAFGPFGSVESYFGSIGGGYPTVIDTDADARERFRILWTPTYLLVGPDLKVRAFRTDISAGGADNPGRVLSAAREIALAQGAPL
jgi:thiol-disulfide isomerase/thioredoxin